MMKLFLKKHCKKIEILIGDSDLLIVNRDLSKPLNKSDLEKSFIGYMNNYIKDETLEVIGKTKNTKLTIHYNPNYNPNFFI